MNNLKKRLVSLGAAALMCMTAVAGGGSTACAKQVTDNKSEISAAFIRGITANDAEEDPVEALMEMFFGEDCG